MVESLMNAVVQVVLFAAIPFVWWFFSARKEYTFFTWMGFKKPTIENKRNYMGLFLLIIVLLVVPINIIIYYFVDSSLLVSHRFTNLGFSVMIPALIYAILQTGLSEELFFRGFLTKRLISKFGFYKGNVMQSLVFGSVHGWLLFSSIHIVAVLLIVIATALAGYLMGWINEKKSNGSIISSWMIHSIANIIASFVAMFPVF
ncbi:CPBP family intramembrane glutamic endopeptidase [Lysinibacillus sphaericus]|uniref:CPBP family intramembrane glutamic endopeptidase n=1 Tax=Lysinibacillus sphaericus TaxID=1421 RepID=UPI003F7AF96F